VTGAIIVHGVEHDVLSRWPAKDPEVRLWEQSGLAFRGLPRRTETRAVWVHWTAGENPADGLMQTLRAAHTSVNFFVDQAGVIWQFADAAMATAHAGGPNVVLSANPWACSIEVANRATADGEHKRWPREVVEDTINGHAFKVTRFYDAQIVAVVALVETLCDAFGLPMDVPRDVDGKLDTNTLSIEELRTFRGVGGHFHNHRTKRDPGSEILREIANHPMHARDRNAE
jgi:N-acetyl-anhydromuramyl-L-alanine amidase AmpD